MKLVPWSLQINVGLPLEIIVGLPRRAAKRLKAADIKALIGCQI